MRTRSKKYSFVISDFSFPVFISFRWSRTACKSHLVGCNSRVTKRAHQSPKKMLQGSCMRKKNNVLFLSFAGAQKIDVNLIFGYFYKVHHVCLIYLRSIEILSRVNLIFSFSFMQCHVRKKLCVWRTRRLVVQEEEEKDWHFFISCLIRVEDKDGDNQKVWFRRKKKKKI